MTRAIANQVVETLAAAGVERVYGIVGDSLNGFTMHCAPTAAVDHVDAGRPGGCARATGFH